MSNVPADLRYTKSHEWAPARGRRHRRPSASPTTPSRRSATSCSSRLPEVGRRVAAGEACAVVESVKAASDVYRPVSGEVVAGNADARRAAGAGQPGSLRRGLDHAGPPRRQPQFAAMLDAKAYEAALAAETH